MFSTLYIINFSCSFTSILSSANALKLDQFKIFSFGKELTLSKTSPGFYTSPLCLQQAISSFPTVFSTSLENLLPFSSKLKLSSANSFSLEESKICHLGKG